MPRNMSFAMTTTQMYARTKTMTRRFGWWFAKPGDIYWAAEKSMGLKKGEKIKRIALIRITATRPESLNAISPADVTREGFPDWEPRDFIDMIVKHYRCDETKICNVITFKFLPFSHTEVIAEASAPAQARREMPQGIQQGIAASEDS